MPSSDHASSVSSHSSSSRSRRPSAGVSSSSRGSQRSTRQPERRKTKNHQKVLDRKLLSTFTRVGRYARKCLHPYISVINLLAVGQELVSPGSSDEALKLPVEEYREYKEYAISVMQYSPRVELGLKLGDEKQPELGAGLNEGFRSCQSSDKHTIKENIVEILGPSFCKNRKSDRGFNHNVTGRMLIPIEYIGDYDSNPVTVRDSIREGQGKYIISSDRLPAFLYEDPSNFNSEDILEGLLRGEYLLKCFKVLFIAPGAANEDVVSLHSNSALSKFKITKITVPMIVYTAVQARFALTTCERWDTPETGFQYEEFVDTLLQICKVEPEWTESTLNWWNEKIFKRKEGQLCNYTRKGPGSAVEKARAQAAQRRAAKESAEKQQDQNCLHPPEDAPCDEEIPDNTFERELSPLSVGDEDHDQDIFSAQSQIGLSVDGEEEEEEVPVVNMKRKKSNSARHQPPCRRRKRV